MSASKKEYKKVTVKSLVDMKKRGEKISMLTPMILPWQKF